MKSTPKLKLWANRSKKKLSSSSLPSSEDESKGRSESGNDQTCGTGTCLCLNKNPEGELFFPWTTLLWDAILAKDDCGCQQDMTWKNQQMEMKNKGAPERDGKGKWSREMWRVRVNHGK
jgi:hypothetical protein